jgi:hypothetical protein
MYNRLAGSSQRVAWANCGSAETTMKLDIATMSALLASDDALTDYDFWRAIKMIDDELYQVERTGQPIPIRMIYARHVLTVARAKRLRRTS